MTEIDPEFRDRPEKPLKLRLTNKLGLAGIVYASEYFRKASDWIDPEILRGRELNLAQIAWTAIQEGKITGRLALDFMDSTLLDHVANVSRDNILLHGSPHVLSRGQYLEPRQATWDDINGHKYADGKAALCCSRTYELPTIRSLFHSSRPELQGIPMLLAKRVDMYGNAYWFASEEALEALTGLRGIVYPVENKIITGAGIDEGSYDRVRNEYRIHAERRPITQISVGVEDLPPWLNIIRASDARYLSRMSLFANPREWGDAMRISVRPIGGLWPLDHFPCK